MILTKDEVVKMARQVWPEVSAGAPMPDGLERFATLCRAPLVAELEQAKKDAARYRWLVSQPNGGFFHPVFAVNSLLSWRSKDQYDAAIDAAIAKEAA